MKALSVRAPWWWFILHCAKDIENRDWPTGYRGTVLLHASKWWKQDEAEDDFDYAVGCYEEANNVTMNLDITEPEVALETLRKIRSSGGCIVGMVDIVDCVKESESPWFFGEYGFALRKPVAFEKPIPFRGALGFFNIPDSILREAKHATAQ